MTHNPSRKQFVAKLLGASAALTVGTKLVANPESAAAAASATGAQPSTARKFELRHDPRAVSRRDSL